MFQLASKEYQKGYESPRADKGSVYASSSFRSDTNGGSGEYSSKYKDVAGNTLSKLDGPVGFSTLPEQVHQQREKYRFSFFIDAALLVTIMGRDEPWRDFFKEMVRPDVEPGS